MTVVDGFGLGGAPLMALGVVAGADHRDQTLQLTLQPRSNGVYMQRKWGTVVSTTPSSSVSQLHKFEGGRYSHKTRVQGNIPKFLQTPQRSFCDYSTAIVPFATPNNWRSLQMVLLPVTTSDHYHA